MFVGWLPNQSILEQVGSTRNDHTQNGTLHPKIVSTLKAISKDSSDLLRGTVRLFEEDLNLQDPVVQKLVHVQESDSETKNLLKKITAAMHTKDQRPNFTSSELLSLRPEKLKKFENKSQNK